MPEEKVDVNAVSSPAQSVESSEPQATQTESVSQETPSPAVTPASELSATDSKNVPLDNYEAEWKRKYNNLADKMPEYIDQAVQSAVQTITQKQTPQVTPEQLRAIIHDDTGSYTVGNKVWAEQELQKLNEQKISQLFDEKFQITEKKQHEALVKKDSEQYVMNTFPEMFKRDVNGNIVGWDTTHPMTQLTARYMQQLGNRPDAIREASRQAFADYQLINRKEVERKVLMANSETAAVKKQNMPNAGGTVQSEANSLQLKVNEAFNKFKQSGNVEDAIAYNKLKGQLAAMKLKG